MALYLKANVKFGSGTVAICVATQVVEGIFNEIGKPCTITSANDSTHSAASLHYKDRAIDIRSKILSETEKDWVLAQMKLRLNEQFDILLESRGTPNEHYHLEFDPK